MPVITQDVLADGKRGFGLPEGEEYVFSMLPLFCADHGRRCLENKHTNITIYTQGFTKY